LKEVLKFARILNNYKLDFVITGHSLGGRLAAATARWTGKKAIIFKAAGFHGETFRAEQDYRIEPNQIVPCAFEGE
jgi:adenine/guanine phosphoribosyltransferase-like PRPP-binding protein